METRGAVSRWLSTKPVTHVGAPIAALVLGVSGLFGGLDPVPLADRVERVEPGTEIAVDPFALTVKQAVVIGEIPGLIRPRTPGNHLMAILLDVENQTRASLGSHLLVPVPRAESYLNRTLVVLDDALIGTTPSVYDADSNVAVTQLSPGLTYRLAVVWEFGGTVPDRLPLGLAKLTLRGTTISPDVLEWQDPAEAATLTVPVRNLVGSAP